MTENNIQPIENTTFVPDIRPDLSEYSSDELVSLYVDIDQQTQLYKGTILLEARKRLPSNIEFGEWCISVQTLCLDSQKSMNRYMHLAAYFQDKNMKGISLSVGYEISSPQNAEIADAVYEMVLHQDLSVAEAKELIQEEKLVRGIPVKIQKDSRIVKTIPKSESKFKHELESLLGSFDLPIDKMISILGEFNGFLHARKTKIQILLLVLELIKDQKEDLLRQIQILLFVLELIKEQKNVSVGQDHPEPLDNNTVSLQVPGTNHKQQRNDLCACGSGLKYKKCCLI